MKILQMSFMNYPSCYELTPNRHRLDGGVVVAHILADFSMFHFECFLMNQSKPKQHFAMNKEIRLEVERVRKVKTS